MFAKLGAAGWEQMVLGTGQDSQYHDDAWKLFLKPYDLAEFAVTLHSGALRDIAAADAAGLVESWELNLFDSDEIELIEGVKNDAKQRR